jgi:hypothetical protein
MVVWSNYLGTYLGSWITVDSILASIVVEQNY